MFVFVLPFDLVIVDVAEVHDKVLSHKGLEEALVAHIKLRMVLQTSHQLLHSLFMLLPVFF